MNIAQRKQKLREAGLQLQALRFRISDIADEHYNEMVDLPPGLRELESGMSRDIGKLTDACNLLDSAYEILEEVYSS